MNNPFDINITAITTSDLLIPLNMQSVIDAKTIEITQGRHRSRNRSENIPMKKVVMDERNAYEYDILPIRIPPTMHPTSYHIANLEESASE